MKVGANMKNSSKEYFAVCDKVRFNIFFWEYFRKKRGPLAFYISARVLDKFNSLQQLTNEQV